jgi:hypothetical protein
VTTARHCNKDSHTAANPLLAFPTHTHCDYNCDNSKNFVPGMQVSEQIALTNGTAPVYGLEGAKGYCKGQCTAKDGCTGFFFQKNATGFETCGFYSTELNMTAAVLQGFPHGAVCAAAEAATGLKRVVVYHHGHENKGSKHTCKVPATLPGLPEPACQCLCKDADDANDVHATTDSNYHAGYIGPA